MSTAMTRSMVPIVDVNQAPPEPGIYVLHSPTVKTGFSRGGTMNLKQRLATHRRAAERYGCPISHVSWRNMPGAKWADVLAAEKGFGKKPNDVREMELAFPSRGGRTHDALLIGTTSHRAETVARARRLPRQATWFAIGAPNRSLAVTAATRAATRNPTGGQPAILAAMVPVGVLDRLRRTAPGFLRPVEGSGSGLRWYAQPEAVELINRHIDSIRVLPVTTR